MLLYLVFKPRRTSKLTELGVCTVGCVGERDGAGDGFRRINAYRDETDSRRSVGSPRKFPTKLNMNQSSRISPC